MRTVYGESLATPEDTNHRGQAYRTYDTAGMLEATEFDFKGNPLSQTRRFASDFKTRPDRIALASVTDPATIQGLANSLLESETFTLSMTLDALDRVVTSTTPDSSITSYSYGEGGLLQAVSVHIKGAISATSIVTDIDYNARASGRRRRTATARSLSGSTTPKSFRVRRIHTTRPNPDPDEREVQDLCYHYDPSGNIAELRDLAQQVIFFQNASVEPTQKFVYDAVYRLIEATGREHHTLTMPTLRQNDRSAAELDADMGRGRRLAYADHGSGEIKR